MNNILDFTKIGFRIGKIIKAEILSKARKPSYKLWVDIGNNHIRQSSAQIVNNYKLDEIINKKVICAINFPPIRIAGFKSEILIVGFPDYENNTTLFNCENHDEKNNLVYINNFIEENFNEDIKITYDDFQKLNIISATIIDIEEIENDKESYYINLDIGKDNKVKSILYNMGSQKIANTYKNTQIAIIPEISLIKCEKFKIHILTYKSYDGKYLPIKVDKKINNGEKLF